MEESLDCHPTTLARDSERAITRSSSSSGYLGFCMVSVAQSLASLTMPLSLSVRTPWRSTTQSMAERPWMT